MSAQGIDVSIVIPAFGRIEPLKYTLRSVGYALAQWPGTAEVIVVDDGSQVPIREQLAEFDAHCSIRHLRQVNAGSIVARNNGLQQCTGRYVLFLDSDDLIHPHKFAAHLSRMQEAGADVSYCDMARATLARGYAVAEFAPDARLDTVDSAADLYLRVQPAPHSPIYRRDYLMRHLTAPMVGQNRALDPVGDVWIYYNLAAFPAKVVKVDAALSAPGPHLDDRYSMHWEALGVSALMLAEAFFDACPDNDSTLHARQVAGEAAFHSWRRLPRGFSSDYSTRLLKLWRRSPHGSSKRLGGEHFQRLASLIGPENAATLLRLRNHHYSACRTMDETKLRALLATAKLTR